MNQPPKSYLSPKVKMGPSKIEGIGLLAIDDIKKGELVGIKDGYIIDRASFLELGGWHSATGKAMLQITDDFFLGPQTYDQVILSMMHVNHSCNPTVGLLGNCVCIAMRDIEPGEELSSDYAMFLSDPDFNLNCTCGNSECRHNITGLDWQITELQKKYNGYFSSYIQLKINNLK